MCRHIHTYCVNIVHNYTWAWRGNNYVVCRIIFLVFSIFHINSNMYCIDVIMPSDPHICIWKLMDVVNSTGETPECKTQPTINYFISIDVETRRVLLFGLEVVR